MRTRRIVDETFGATRKRSVVWFGSSGVDANGKAKFVNAGDKHDNFSSGIEMVKDSLIQRLSVIRHELWWNWQYGMPLVDDDTAQITIDDFVMKTISQHPNVISIMKFSSKVEGRNYTCNVEFKTSFGVTSISL